MSQNYQAFLASEPIQAYIQGQCGLATGFDSNPVFDVYAHADNGLRQARPSLTRMAYAGAVILATLDTVAMRNPPTDPAAAFQAMVWLTDMGGLFGMPDHLQPHNPIQCEPWS